MVTIGRGNEMGFGGVGNVFFLYDNYTGANFVIIPPEVHFCSVFGCYI